MNITITGELEELINEQLKSGAFDSPNQVIREGLRLLREQNQLREIRREELRREIQKGVDAVKEGRFKTYDSADEMIEDVIGEARAEFEARKQNGK
jgi:antitoxin ParD1/3/4